MCDFDAVRGIQAENEFFVITCPLRTIPKLFTDESAALSPEIRAQRILNKARIPVLKNYILNNPKEYIFSSLAASVDGEMKFVPAPHLGPDGTVGKLYISLDARILVNDGQHRKRAIEEAIKEKQSLGYESISIVLLSDKGLERSQQMFADLNKNALKPSKSLSILYDRRDSFSQFVVKLAGGIDVFRGRVDFERTSIGNRNSKVFTLNGIHDATKKFLGIGRARRLTEEEMVRATLFWEAITNSIPEWQYLIKGKIQPKTLRDEFVHSNTNCLNSLGNRRPCHVADIPERVAEEAQGTAQDKLAQGQQVVGREAASGRLDGAHDVRDRAGGKRDIARVRRAALKREDGV